MDHDEELERALAGISGDLNSQPAESEPERRERPAPAAAPARGPAPTSDGNLKSVRNSVLVDLQPLATQINLPNTKKFELLMQIYDATKDTKLIELAYQAGRSIDNESERADALLRVIREIDALG
ncbi:hypothetical protein FWH13_00850 [Candidatus Saccharibacteria bacterium]|nr:hypothetical protein [Candidatus Saccharibacteria bacterium]